MASNFARVHCKLQQGPEALRHALTCEALTGSNKTQMKDFDIAYAEEALARAHSVLGDEENAAQHRQNARALGDQIAEAEDKKIFDGDFAAGD